MAEKRVIAKLFSTTLPTKPFDSAQGKPFGAVQGKQKSDHEIPPYIPEEKSHTRFCMQPYALRLSVLTLHLPKCWMLEFTVAYAS